MAARDQGEARTALGGRTAPLIATAVLVVSCASAPLPATRPAGDGGEQLTANDVLADTVYSKLNADPIYYFRHVNVSVDRGIAQLSGFVWSTDAIYRARYIAQSVPGINGVVTSQLELERNGRSDGVAR